MPMGCRISCTTQHLAHPIKLCSYSPRGFSRSGKDDTNYNEAPLEANLYGIMLPPRAARPSSFPDQDSEKLFTDQAHHTDARASIPWLATSQNSEDSFAPLGFRMLAHVHRPASCTEVGLSDHGVSSRPPWAVGHCFIGVSSRPPLAVDHSSFRQGSDLSPDSQEIGHLQHPHNHDQPCGPTP